MGGEDPIYQEGKYHDYKTKREGGKREKKKSKKGAGWTSDMLPKQLQGTGIGAKMDIISYSGWVHNKGRTAAPPGAPIQVKRRDGPGKGKEIDIIALNEKLKKNQEEEDILFQKFDFLQEFQERFEQEREKRRIAEEEERIRLQTEREAANENALREAEAREKAEKEAAELKILEDIVQKLLLWISSMPRTQTGQPDYNSVEMPEGILMEHIEKIKPVSMGGTAPEVVATHRMTTFYNGSVECFKAAEKNVKRKEEERIANEAAAAAAEAARRETERQLQEQRIDQSTASLFGQVQPPVQDTAGQSTSALFGQGPPEVTSEVPIHTVTPAVVTSAVPTVGTQPAAVVTPPGESTTGTTTRPLSVQELRAAARARMDGRGGNKKSKKNRRNKQAGGRVLMPIQYFGGQLNRYYPAGSPQLNPLPSAYGQTVARSFGTTDPTLLKLNATAPNLGPMGLGSNGENMSCGVQTGGRRKRTLKTRNQIKLRQKSYNRGLKSSKCRGKGPAVCRSLDGCK